MQLVKNYKENKELRDSFNKLAEAIFGLNFENWYQSGYWRENYIPYSIIEDGKIVSNVSVNHTKMLIDSKERFYIQLGTVMTYEEYRNRGYVRKLMEEVMRDYSEKVDGIYLFANDTVCDFYPKFGFEIGKEYQYTKELQNDGECQFVKHIMNGKADWNALEGVMNANICHGKMDMIGNNDLIMFYATQFMAEDVYYHEATDTYIIAEIEDDRAFVHNVFSSTLNNLEVVLELLGKEIKFITLGFVPLNPEKYQKIELKEEDTTFFIQGKELKKIEEEYLRIPSLAHA